MIRYQGNISDFTFEDIRAELPNLSREVFDVLAAMSPEQMEFLLADLPVKFNSKEVTHEGMQIMGTLMSEALEQDDLVMTRDEIVLCYARFCELVFLGCAMRQGIIVPQLTDTAIDYYFTMDEQSPAPPVKRVIRGSSYQRFAQTGNPTR